MLTAKAVGHYLLHKHTDSSCQTGTVAVSPRIVEQGLGYYFVYSQA